MGSLDNIVFKKKKFSDILSEIYDNQKKKETQISGLISELKPLINDIGDATLIVPLIKEYMEIGIRNDEQLIKMATIIQRALNNSSSEDGLGITDAEKEELMAELDKLNSDFKKSKEE
jgi:bifunctional N-acetylglucosamine-1-phosphate-uridyltransferase/glucosamine-1-phosphate-acetyltransferase GlmU-like protein